MKNKLNIFLIVIFSLLFLSIFHNWFFQGEIIGGDWPYLFKESLQNYYFIVPSWNIWQGNGLGGTNPIYFLQTFEYLTVFISTFLHVPWPAIYKIFWFGFFIGSSVFSSIYFINVVLKRATLWQKLLAAIIFTTNTYVLMLIDGGQMGVALAYAITPLVIAGFLELMDNLGVDRIFSGKNIRLGLLAGLFLALQIIFDPRLAYISVIAVGIYFIFKLKRNIRNTMSLIFNTFIVPGLAALLINIFWLLPLFIFSQNTCERFCEAYSGIGIVKFLSFSSFSQSLSLLHPNWPENIFGKVGFMKSEFLVIPIFAYISLFFINNKKINIKILFFALMGIIGAFLSKGANPPFGDIYLWLSENIPGFVLFRDPTKFYLLTALSFSILIPYSLLEISSRVSGFKRKILLVVFLAFWVISIRPAVLGQLRGTFKKHIVPKEYVELKDFLYKQPEFFRTLWVPRQHRFTYVSNMHPSVEAGALFEATSSAQAIKDIKEKGQQYFSELSVKYIIVPYDNLGEIFQKDRKYDDEQYENVIKALDSISWLQKINGFGKIRIFETSLPKDHFWLVNGGDISYKMHSPTHYFLNVSLSSAQKLIFSENFNQSWAVKINERLIKSQKTSNNLNSFDLEKGSYDLEIIFLQDKLYSYARAISFLSLFVIIFLILKSGSPIK